MRLRTTERSVVDRGIGASAARPDGRLKVTGEYAYSSDLWSEGMLWGATLRSPHASARVRAVDVAAARAMPGVHAVLTYADVPGHKTYGMVVDDQPVLASDVVRYQGEPVVIVAADHPEIARRALARVRVDYDLREPLTDAERALEASAPALHPDGNLVRHVRIRQGDVASSHADVVVTGEFEVGMQDQAFLGPESGMAIPLADGSIELHVSSQGIHHDLRQVAACLGMSEERVRVRLAGVGGAFGGREDLSMHVHACMLALRTGRPVKMVYSREESFFGHVHRHPATMAFEHRATRDGKLVSIRARILFDGGAYASTSPIVVFNGACFLAGPYEVPNVEIDGYVVYTNNPPCGAMRGFGAVQGCFGYESMMDRLAAELGMSSVEIRLRNAMRTGTSLPTGQRVHGPAPVEEMLRRVSRVPLPPATVADGDATPDLRLLPGGVSNVTHGEGVRRGVGYALGVKAVNYSAGADDVGVARVRLVEARSGPLVEIKSSAAENGQGLITVMAQIARTELSVDAVHILEADTSIADSGSTSASRQTWMTGGAVKLACEAVRDEVFARAAPQLGAPPSQLRLEDGDVVADVGRVALGTLLREGPIEATREFRHRRTSPLDPETGQGEAHVAFAFAAHRAVVDVDVELGLVKVVEIATAQDVGKAMNPIAVEGQIEGATAQGLGLALMEEIQLQDGLVRNPSFTDYLIPTILDMPSMHVDILECPHPDAPYGLNGAGEPGTLSSTPAIVAAIRAATGRELRRVPVRADEIVGLEPVDE